jgi:hypothetical protein
MDKRLEGAIEKNPEETLEKANDIRTLNDLDLALVGGGGDDSPNW